MPPDGNHAPQITRRLPRRGDVLRGKYRVDANVGEGGMAVVVAATHLQLQRRVALKILKLEFISNQDIVARFLKEARAAAALTSEHVTHVLDVGTLDNGAPYLVMEYLRGRDLATQLREQGRIGPEGAVDIVLQASEAIAEAHARGIIHRDIKPENLFAAKRADGSTIIKVLDFGIAKAATAGIEEQGPGVTQGGGTFGSPAYMSPEQVRSARDVDVRTDIWSLGVVLFELVAGRQPFRGASPAELCASVLRDRPPMLDTLVQGLPIGYSQAVNRCLQKDADKRYASVAEFAAAFAGFGGRRAMEYAQRCRTVLSGGPSTMPPPAPVVSDAWVEGGGELSDSSPTEPRQTEMVPEPDAKAAEVSMLTLPHVDHVVSTSQLRSKLLYRALVSMAGVFVVTVLIALAAGLVARRNAARPVVVQAAAPGPSPSAVVVASAEPSASAPVDVVIEEPAPSASVASTPSASLSVKSAPPSAVPGKRYPVSQPGKKVDLYGSRR